MIYKDIWLLFFIPFIALIVYFLRKTDKASSIKFPSEELVRDSQPTLKLTLARKLIYLRAAVIVLFLFALARPRIPLEDTKVHTEGIDIVLAIDCSGSMLAEDFKINGNRLNRLEVVRRVVQDFIRARNSDRIAMIAFAARAYTVCPLTLDYEWLIKNLERVQIGTIEDGTAVGSAISSSLNRLRDTEAKSKIVILLTDGVNNTGTVAPLTAAQAAKALGIKIYTVGAGTEGLVPYPVKGFWGQTVYQNVKIQIDEDTLQKIAQDTNAKYYRATDTESLRKIYQEIDALEKTPVQESGFQAYKELFSRFLILGLLGLVLEMILSNTILRRLP